MGEVKKNILVADDDKFFRDLLRGVLQKEGYSVQTVESGVSAIREILKEKFQVLILDIYMAGIDGFETISILKRIDSHLPIIVITGNNSLQIEKKIRAKGIFYYLVKPFDMKEMKEVVKLALKKYSQRGYKGEKSK